MLCDVLLLASPRTLAPIFIVLVIEFGRVERKDRTTCVLLYLLLNFDIASGAITVVTEEVVLHVTAAGPLTNQVGRFFLD